MFNSLSLSQVEVDKIQWLDFLNQNSSSVGVILTALGLVGAAIAFFWKKFSRNGASKIGTGGTGGNATVGGHGIALGGHGGRSGHAGNGGSGGDATVSGEGMAVGGAGGDSGVPWRPTLGGASPAEKMLSVVPAWPPMAADNYGFLIPGRGGIGGDEHITVDVNGDSLALVPLLRYLNYWAPDIIDQADSKLPSGPQNFWDVARQNFPSETKAAEEHVRYCQKVSIPGGIAALSPYIKPA